MWVEDRESSDWVMNYLPPYVWESVNHLIATARESIGRLLDRWKSYYEDVKSRTCSQAMTFIREEGSSGNRDIEIETNEPRMILNI